MNNIVKLILLHTSGVKLVVEAWWDGDVLGDETGTSLTLIAGKLLTKAILWRHSTPSGTFNALDIAAWNTFTIKNHFM